MWLVLATVGAALLLWSLRGTIGVRRGVGYNTPTTERFRVTMLAVGFVMLTIGLVGQIRR